jgi:hypothetical protein
MHDLIGFLALAGIMYQDKPTKENDCRRKIGDYEFRLMRHSQSY